MSVLRRIQNKPFPGYGAILLYGVLLALMLFLLQWLKLRFIVMDYYVEIYAGAIAVTFTLLGFWIAFRLTKPTMDIVPGEQDTPSSDGNCVTVNGQAMQHGLSKRELDVLALMAEGLSNQEIAVRLFVSLNTVKTHSSRIFDKMEVKRRTQAVDKARKMGFIP